MPPLGPSPTPVLVASSDGVSVAVHDLGGPDDVDSPVVLLSHATGFHGRVWAPMASHLVDRFRCLAVDYRGHGVACTPDGLDFHWRGFADDAEAVLASDLIPDGPPVYGVGHSLGGAALVMAAARRPDAFAGLWLFEPITPPIGAALSSDGPNPMAETSRRRRPTFDSYEAAFRNFASKVPLDQLHPDALREYVEGGFAEQADGTVTLRCRREWEAATFEMTRSSGAWDLLAGLQMPVAVVVGEEVPFGPANFAPAIAERLPRGELVEYRELGHFGPLQAPEKLAAEFASWVDGIQ